MQGGTLVYMMMVDMPHMQDRVASLIAMGPPVFMEYMQAPFLRAWAKSRNDKVRALTLGFNALRGSNAGV
jgi:hypothetical protein